jgi:hypothetical protein
MEGKASKPNAHKTLLKQSEKKAACLMRLYMQQLDASVGFSTAMISLLRAPAFVAASNAVNPANV